MTLQNDAQLQNTRRKLAELEAHFEARRKEEGGDEYVRELSLRSIKKLINQLKEEIARYEARQTARP